MEHFENNHSIVIKAFSKKEAVSFHKFLLTEFAKIIRNLPVQQQDAHEGGEDIGYFEVAQQKIMERDVSPACQEEWILK